MLSSEFEPATPATKRPHTCTSDRAATGIDPYIATYTCRNIVIARHHDCMTLVQHILIFYPLSDLDPVAFHGSGMLSGRVFRGRPFEVPVTPRVL
jgi:hypothetical protein